MTDRSLAAGRSPAELLATLATEPGAVLLEIPDPERPATVIGCRPVAELRVGGTDPDPLGTIARFVDESPRADPAVPFPLGGGVVVCLDYELGARTVPGLVAPSTGSTVAVLRRYDPLVVVDHRHGRTTVVGDGRAAWLGRLGAPAPAW